MERLLRVNDVMVFSEENITERILWINPSCSNIFTINLKSSKLQINYRKIEEMEEKIERSEIYFDNESYKNRLVSIENMSESELSLLESSWNIIKLIALENNEPDIYIKNYRIDLIKKVTDELNVSKTTVYKYLKKYWTGGKTKMALLSDFRNCGGKGKSKISTNKLGRPREVTKEQGRNLTKKDKELFVIALKKYRKPGGKVSLRKVYDLLISVYYTSCEIVDGEVMIDEDRSPKPSFSQFRNWYYSNDQSIKTNIVNEKGEKEYFLNHAPKSSNSKHSTFGPGFRYETDSTIPPIYLSNRIMSGEKFAGKDRNVGRPTLTLVVDVFSTLVTGVSIEPSNASWENTTSALYNCTENKLDFCKSFNLKIKQGEWPDSSLPKKLLADNGELGGKAPEQLTEFLNIEIENTRTYMGKDKGLVEGVFVN
ncbi:MAG: hypothetical protein FH761_18240 [Firmicutes bacterium]|nr:hypothetical protein [Bacillota bacterium]